MEQLKLLPCSCEAGDKELKIQNGRMSYNGIYSVLCSCGKRSDWCKTPEAAKEAWNIMRQEEINQSIRGGTDMAEIVRNGNKVKEKVAFPVGHSLTDRGITYRQYLVAKVYPEMLIYHANMGYAEWKECIKQAAELTWQAVDALLEAEEADNGSNGYNS